MAGCGLQSPDSSPSGSTGRKEIETTGDRSPEPEPGDRRPMQINPSIFKAYDIRGLYPGEINEDTARAIGRGFIAYLKAKTIAVSRDMRVSSPALAAAFIE